MATNVFVPSTSSADLAQADEKLAKKPLNFSRYIPHELYSKSSGNEETAKRRVSGLRLSHAVKLSYSSDLDDVQSSQS